MKNAGSHPGSAGTEERMLKHSGGGGEVVPAITLHWRCQQSQHHSNWRPTSPYRI